MGLQRLRVLIYKVAAAVMLLMSLAGNGAAQRKKIVLGEITVEGRRQKPQAFYILQRQSLSFDGLELKKSFLPKIKESVEKQPF